MTAHVLIQVSMGRAYHCCNNFLVAIAIQQVFILPSLEQSDLAPCFLVKCLRHSKTRLLS